MLKVVTFLALAVPATLALPSRLDAWGAARVSATRVGPAGGVYHRSRTVAAGPGGVYSSGRDGGAYGASYRGYSGGAYRYGYGYGGASYGYRYGYVR